MDNSLTFPAGERTKIGLAMLELSVLAVYHKDFSSTCDIMEGGGYAYVCRPVQSIDRVSSAQA